MRKKLEIKDIKEDKLVRLDVTIHLNKMVLTLEKKNKNLEIGIEYQKLYDIKIDSNIDEIIYDFYVEYVELKSIELFWQDNLKDSQIIEIDLDGEN